MNQSPAQLANFLRRQPDAQAPSNPPGARPKYGVRMVQISARVPPDVKQRLIDEYGTIQGAVDALLIEPHLPIDNL